MILGGFKMAKYAYPAIFTPEENEMRNLIKSSSKYLWPHPNDDIEFITPLFNTKKHYQYLKKMIWKHYRR